VRAKALAATDPLAPDEIVTNAVPVTAMPGALATGMAERIGDRDRKPVGPAGAPAGMTAAPAGMTAAPAGTTAAHAGTTAAHAKTTGPHAETTATHVATNVAHVATPGAHARKSEDPAARSAPANVLLGGRDVGRTGRPAVRGRATPGAGAVHLSARVAGRIARPAGTATGSDVRLVATRVVPVGRAAIGRRVVRGAGKVGPRAPRGAGRIVPRAAREAGRIVPPDARGAGRIVPPDARVPGIGRPVEMIEGHARTTVVRGERIGVRETIVVPAATIAGKIEVRVGRTAALATTGVRVGTTVDPVPVPRGIARPAETTGRRTETTADPDATTEDLAGTTGRRTATTADPDAKTEDPAETTGRRTATTGDPDAKTVGTATLVAPAARKPRRNARRPRGGHRATIGVPRRRVRRDRADTPTSGRIPSKG
jgi:hypothetical protein